MAETQGRLGRTTDPTAVLRASESLNVVGRDYPMAGQVAAGYLDAYAEAAGVTFLAIPTEVLKAVREAWETNDDSVLMGRSLHLLRDLFGGIDGYLTAIDSALGPR